ncbi:MAG TPA: tyrosine-type recombinase/integrase [Acidimicrobiales bacterium]|nr:tyrosine-type recombinase/integrase [Acidimicrobiales bacterium]
MVRPTLPRFFRPVRQSAVHPRPAIQAPTRPGRSPPSGHRRYRRRRQGTPLPASLGRHTYATDLLRRGVDIHVVQRLLGHTNIATTTRYLHLSDTDLIPAVDHAFRSD